MEVPFYDLPLDAKAEWLWIKVEDYILSFYMDEFAEWIGTNVGEANDCKL